MPEVAAKPSPRVPAALAGPNRTRSTERRTGSIADIVKGVVAAPLPTPQAAPKAPMKGAGGGVPRARMPYPRTQSNLSQHSVPPHPLPLSQQSHHSALPPTQLSQPSQSHHSRSPASRSIAAPSQGSRGLPSPRTTSPGGLTAKALLERASSTRTRTPSPGNKSAVSAGRGRGMALNRVVPNRSFAGSTQSGAGGVSRGGGHPMSVHGSAPSLQGVVSPTTSRAPQSVHSASLQRGGSPVAASAPSRGEEGASQQSGRSTPQQRLASILGSFEPDSPVAASIPAKVAAEPLERPHNLEATGGDVFYGQFGSPALNVPIVKSEFVPTPDSNAPAGSFDASATYATRVDSRITNNSSEVVVKATPTYSPPTSSPLEPPVDAVRRMADIDLNIKAQSEDGTHTRATSQASTKPAVDEEVGHPRGTVPIGATSPSQFMTLAITPASVRDTESSTASPHGEAESRSAGGPDPELAPQRKTSSYSLSSATETQRASPDLPPPRTNRTGDTLWSAFTEQMQKEQGVENVTELHGASEAEVADLVSSLCHPPFTLVEKLKLKSMWVSKVVPPPPPPPPPTSIPVVASPATEVPSEAASSSPSNMSERRKRNGHADAGRLENVPQGCGVWDTVRKVVKNSVSAGSSRSEVEVEKVVQLVASDALVARFEREQRALDEPHRTPLILYFIPPSGTAPDLQHIVGEGFNSFLKSAHHQGKVALEFSSEVTCIEGGVSHFVVCEVITGRVKRSSGTVGREIPSGYDSVGIDYEYRGRGGAEETASRYFVGRRDRVLPRFSVYVSSMQSGEPRTGFASSLHAIRTPPPAHLRIDSTSPSPRRQSPGTPPMISPHQAPRGIMCVHHEHEELRLYCVAEKELTCALCASIGRHSGTQCVSLASLLQGMRSQFVHNETVVERKLAVLEAEDARLVTQHTAVSDATLQSKSAVQLRVLSIQTELEAKAALVAERLQRKEEQALLSLSLQQKDVAAQAASLHKAQACLRSLLDTDDQDDRGISHKAADIISLSKLLDQDRPVEKHPRGGGGDVAVELVAFCQSQV